MPRNPKLPAYCSAAARMIAIFGLTLLAACSVPQRTPFTLDDQLSAEIDGYENIRFYADAPTSQLTQFRNSYLPRGNGGRPEYLALSGGGEGGAFGAGMLVGWSESGTRPEFDLVTGVSAGSLIAPMAFVGSDTDPVLQDIFTSGIVTNLNKNRSILFGLLDVSIFSNKQLKGLIDHFLTDDLVRRIAERHRQGARLLIITTDLDIGRSVVWDAGAIAASGQPGARDLLAQVLEASASIPAIFPPMLIDVTADGKNFQELHVDGGAIRDIYFLPDNFIDEPNWAGLPPGNRPRIHAIVNGEVGPRFSLVQDRSVKVAQRSYLTLAKANVKFTIAGVYKLARESGASLRLAYIDKYIERASNEPFDQQFMTAAFKLGREKGRTQDWLSNVPSFPNYRPSN